MMLRNSQRPALRQPGWTIVLTSILFSFAAGCGVVGSPIAPEDIGIEAKIRAQRQAEEQRSTPQAQPVAPEESDIVLPPLQPVGTQ